MLCVFLRRAEGVTAARVILSRAECGRWDTLCVILRRAEGMVEVVTLARVILRRAECGRWDASRGGRHPGQSGMQAACVILHIHYGYGRRVV